jgi:hypothetical protein
MNDGDRSVAAAAAEQQHDDSLSNKRSMKGQQAPVSACDYCRVRKVDPSMLQPSPYPKR